MLLSNKMKSKLLEIEFTEGIIREDCLQEYPLLVPCSFLRTKESVYDGKETKENGTGINKQNFSLLMSLSKF